MLYGTLIDQAARRHGLEKELVEAVIAVESSFRPDVARYEEGYRWLLTPARFAKEQRITDSTETVLQQTSWGLMQLMGATARELGYRGFIPNLCNPETGIHWGCLHLRRLIKRFDDVWDGVAAYNAGSPRRVEDGSYVNQGYVDKVRRSYLRKRGLSE